MTTDYHVHIRRIGTQRAGIVAIDIPGQRNADAAAVVAEAVLASWPTAHHYEIAGVCTWDNTACGRVNG